MHILSNQHISSVLAMSQPKFMVSPVGHQMWWHLTISVRSDLLFILSLVFQWLETNATSFNHQILHWMNMFRGHLFLVIIVHSMKEGLQVNQGTILWDSITQANWINIALIFSLMSCFYCEAYYLSYWYLLRKECIKCLHNWRGKEFNSNPESFVNNDLDGMQEIHMDHCYLAPAFVMLCKR